MSDPVPDLAAVYAALVRATIQMGLALGDEHPAFVAACAALDDLQVLVSEADKKNSN